MSRTNMWSCLTFVAAATAMTAANATGPLPEGTHHYAVHFSGMSVGTLESHLSADQAAGCYRSEGKTKPSSMMAMVYGSPSTLSVFCIVDGQVRPSHLESVMPNDASQSYTLDFDWKKMTVADNAGLLRPITADAVDPITIQPAVRLWARAHVKDATPPVAEFTLVDQKNLTHYQFRIAGHESVTTPAGRFDALKIERIDDPKKTGHYWLLPDRDYLPAIIETQNGNRPVVRFELMD